MSPRKTRKNKLKKIMRQRRVVSVGAMNMAFATAIMTPAAAIGMGPASAIPVSTAGYLMAKFWWTIARDHDADRRDREPK